MTLNVNTPEHDALKDAFEHISDPAFDERNVDNPVYHFSDVNRDFLFFRAGYELWRKGRVEETME